MDDETAKLFDFAEILYQLSDKNLILPLVYLEKFGVFDGSEQVPSLDQINQLLPHIGWDKVKWNQSQKNLLTSRNVTRFWWNW